MPEVPSSLSSCSVNEAPAAVYLYDTSMQCSFILCCVHARSICWFEHIMGLERGEGMKGVGGRAGTEGSGQEWWKLLRSIRGIIADSPILSTSGALHTLQLFGKTKISWRKTGPTPV